MASADESHQLGAGPEARARRFIAEVLASTKHGLSAAEQREVHNRRVQVSVRAASIANPSDILNAVLIALFGIPSELSTFRWVWLLASVLLMANSPRMWWSRCWQQDFVATTRDVRKLFADVIANAALIAVVLVYAMPSADRYQELILLTAYAGVMGCGAIVLSTYRRLATMWVWLNMISLTVVVWLHVRQVAVVITLLLVLYATVLSAAIALLSLSFVTRCRAELAARSERETVRTLLKDFEDGASEWLWECDADGGLTHVSGTLAAQVAIDIGAIQGADLVALVGDLLDSTVADSATPMAVLRDRFANRTSFRDLTLPVVIRNERRWWTLTGHFVADPLDPQQSRWRGVGEDVTAAKTAAEEILRLATTDVLTGLMNRHRFSELLDEMLRAPASPMRLAIVDLDNFKAINDTLGHPVGDQLLVDIVGRLQTSLGESEQFARIGGDEFAIVGTQPRASAADFSDVIRLFEEPFTTSVGDLTIRASIGHAAAPGDAVGSHDLVVAADLALHAAKSEGGNRSTPFEPELAARARARASLLDELRGAIARHEFVAWYQPQVSLQTGRVEAMEALARWEHPTRGIVAPGAFIELAEETGLIAPISDHVMDHACEAARHWPEHVRVAVNVSARQLSDPQFVQRVDDTLRRHALAPGRLDIEVTETAMVQGDAGTTLLALRELGVGISVDDFGTGYASFEAMRTLRPTKLKVDRTFVAALDGPEPVMSRAILAAFVALATAMHVTSVAEGAETPEQQTTLRELGFEYSQGYIDARPAAADQLKF